jgi:hypothetical protein
MFHIGFIVASAVLYVVVLACVLVFFAGVSRINERADELERHRVEELRQRTLIDRYRHVA